MLILWPVKASILVDGWAHRSAGPPLCPCATMGMLRTRKKDELDFDRWRERPVLFTTELRAN